MEAQLTELRDRLHAAAHSVDRLLESHSDEVLTWRPRDDRWSMLEHAAHMNLSHGPYANTIALRLDESRDQGMAADGPFRGRFVGRTFARLMKPPVRRRMRTTRQLVPPPAADLTPDSVREEFAALNRRFEALLTSAEGVDLDRAIVRSPFAKWLKLSMIDAFRLIVFHTERHLWLMREVAEDSSFPGEAA